MPRVQFFVICHVIIPHPITALVASSCFPSVAELSQRQLFHAAKGCQSPLRSIPGMNDQELGPSGYCRVRQDQVQCRCGGLLTAGAGVGQGRSSTPSCRTMRPSGCSTSATPTRCCSTSTTSWSTTRSSSPGNSRAKTSLSRPQTSQPPGPSSMCARPCAASRVNVLPPVVSLHLFHRASLDQPRGSDLLLRQLAVLQLGVAERGVPLVRCVVVPAVDNTLHHATTRHLLLMRHFHNATGVAHSLRLHPCRTRTWAVYSSPAALLFMQSTALPV